MKNLPFKFKQIIGFEWDEGNIEHIKKHGVYYKECEEVFLSKPLIIFFDETHSVFEKRYKVMGVSKKGRKLSLVFTFREDKIRVLTARDQSKKERKGLEGARIGGEKI